MFVNVMEFIGMCHYERCGLLFSFSSSFFPWTWFDTFFLSSMYAYAGKYIGRYRADSTRFSTVVLAIDIAMAMDRMKILVNLNDILNI